MRWPVEQSFEDGKSHLGMGHYEFHSWNAWHRPSFEKVVT